MWLHYISLTNSILNAVNAQVRNSGKVTDQKQIPLGGANIFLQDSYDGATADSLGFFNLKTELKGIQSLSATFIDLKSIMVEDILFFYSLEKATYLCTADFKTYLVDYSLDRISEMVDEHRFFRINRKYILSNQSIADIIFYSRLNLQLNGINQTFS